MKSGVNINHVYPNISFTVLRNGKEQITCRCIAYRFPHRISSGDCHFDKNREHCPSCDHGHCELHETYRSYRSETLSAAERNPGLNESLQRSDYHVF